MADPKSIQFGDPRLPSTFWSKVQVSESGCWLWSGAAMKRGRPDRSYGFAYDPSRKRTKLAHRVAYLTLVGPADSLDHLCRQPRCVTPAHLEPVTQRENTLRGVGISAHNAAKTHCKRGHDLSVHGLTRTA